MYKKAAEDDFRGRFEFKDNYGVWQNCEGILPENRPGRDYRYLTAKETEQVKCYDKDYFVSRTKGSYPTWVRLANCKDMLLVAGVNQDGLTISNVGPKSWENLASQGWQWTQYAQVGSYEDLTWVNFVRE